MKKILLLILGIFLIIDVLLALYLLNPEILNKLQNDQITVRSDIPSLRPSLINRSYLSKKLNERGFWNKKGVNHFTRNIERVTVKKLNLIITNTPQNWGKQLETVNGKDVVVSSYGQRYSPVSENLTVYIQLYQQNSIGTTVDQLYSGYILSALFDLTYKYPVNTVQYDAQLIDYMTDFYNNAQSNKFLGFKSR